MSASRREISSEAFDDRNSGRYPFGPSLVVELNTEVAGAMQYQQEFGQNWIWLITGFLSGRENTRGVSTGIRTELQLFF